MQTLAQAPNLRHSYAQALTYHSLGAILGALGHFEKALGYLEECRACAVTLHDPNYGPGKPGWSTHMLQESCINIANLYHAMGLIPKAIQEYVHGQKIAKELADKGKEEHAWLRLAECYLQLDLHQQAFDSNAQARKLAACSAAHLSIWTMGWLRLVGSFES